MAEETSNEFWEHANAAGKAFENQVKSLFPEKFWEYGKEFRRESLLAAKSVVNGIADSIEDMAESSGEKPKATKKAKVQVE